MPAPPSVQERVRLIEQHLQKSIEWKGEITGILEMRRHYTNYLKGLPHIKEFRNKLVSLSNALQIKETLNDIAKQYEGFCS